MLACAPYRPGVGNARTALYVSSCVCVCMRVMFMTQQGSPTCKQLRITCAPGSSLSTVPQTDDRARSTTGEGVGASTHAGHRMSVFSSSHRSLHCSNTQAVKEENGARHLRTTPVILTARNCTPVPFSLLKPLAQGSLPPV